MKLIYNSIFTSILVFTLVFGSSHAVYAQPMRSMTLMVWSMMIHAMIDYAEKRRSPERQHPEIDADTPPKDFLRRTIVLTSGERKNALYMSPGSAGRHVVNLDVDDSDEEAEESTYNIYVITPYRGNIPFRDLHGVFQTQEQIEEIMTAAEGSIDLRDHRYVGRTTKSMKERFNGHARTLNEGVDRRLYNAIREGAEKGRRFYVRRFLANTHPDQLNLFEALFQKKFKTNGEFGDNSSTSSGESSEERRRKRGRDNDDDDKDGGGSPTAAASSAPVLVY